MRWRPLLILLLLAATARADDGARYRGWTLTALTLTVDPGAPDVARREATALLEAAKPGLALASSGGLFSRRHPDFTPALLQADRRRLSLYLARRGFPRATITPSFTPAARGRRLALTLGVRPGPMARVTDLVLSGLPPDYAAFGDSLARAAADGRRFSEERLAAITSAVGDRLRAGGYAALTVEAGVTPLDSTRVRLDLAVTPGARYVFGAPRVSGVPADLERLAASHLRVLTGKGYAPSLMTRAQNDLRTLQLFRRIDLRDEPAAGDSLAVLAELAPRKPRSTSASVGTWSDHPFRVRAAWEHRNLFGGGRGLRLRGAWSPEQQQGGVDVWWPGLPRPRTTSSLGLAYVAEREASYHQDTATLEAALLIRPWTDTPTQWRPSLSVGYVRADPSSTAEQAFEAGDGLLSILALDASRDGSDDPLEPSRGTRLQARAEYSPAGVLSDYPFASGEAQAVAYATLARFTLAARVAGGLASPLGDATRLLPGKRLFAGGASSMRGYRRRELGPRDASDDPLGGRVRLLAGLELRRPLLGRVGLALFADAGQVWERPRDLRLGELAVAVGPGLLVSTPVGALRGDFAFNLRDAPDRWLFHFSVGHPW